MTSEPETTSQNSSETKSTRSKIIGRVLRRLAFIPLLVVGGLFLLSFTASKPYNLGTIKGRFAECPDSPNCVSSQAEDELHAMPPIPYEGSIASVLKRIKSTIAAEFSNAKLASENIEYLHFEFTSTIFRFVDDVEFVVDTENSVVHFRSASRVGHSDLGVNRKRMNKIIEGMKK